MITGRQIEVACIAVATLYATSGQGLGLYLPDKLITKKPA